MQTSEATYPHPSKSFCLFNETSILCENLSCFLGFLFGSKRYWLILFREIGSKHGEMTILIWFLVLTRVKETRTLFLRAKPTELSSS